MKKCDTKIVLKASIYLVLFILFLKFYLIEQATEFLDGKTTFSTNYEKAEGTEFPSILICFSPPFKTKLGKSLVLALPKIDNGSDYGYDYDYDYEDHDQSDEDHEQGDEDYGPLGDIVNSFLNLAYIEDLDYYTKIRFYSKSRKEIPSQPIMDISQFATLEHGLCTRLAINKQFQDVRKMSLEFVFNATKLKKLHSVLTEIKMFKN